ncbi:MAG: SEC-C metal-binding domain-containing protein [Bryobacteraceae bacterium]
MYLWRAALYCRSTGGASCPTIPTPTSPFTRSSKRRKRFPSETHVKKGLRIVHEEKDLLEKLGRNDPCPCGSRRRFQNLLHEGGYF